MVLRERPQRGWKLCIQLQNGETEWVKLKDLKESHPVEVAECDELKGLLKEPAFAWWFPHVLRKTKRILKAMKARHHRTEQKFDIDALKLGQRATRVSERDLVSGDY